MVCILFWPSLSLFYAFYFQQNKNKTKWYNLSGFSFSSIKWRACTGGWGVGVGEAVLKAAPAPWWLNLQMEISLQMCDAAVLSCGLKTGDS